MLNRIAILGTGLIILCVTGCGLLPIPGNNPEPSPTNIIIPVQRLSTPTVAPTATTAPPTATATLDPAANPLDALRKAFGVLGNVKSFRGKSVRTEGVNVTESNFDFVAPDRYHLVSKTSEFIIISKDYYTKVGTTWRKASLPQGLDFSVADYKKRLDELGTTTDTKFVGPDVLDGVPMLVYQYTFTSKVNNTTITTVSKIWIAVTDGLPRKGETTSSLNPKAKTVSTYYDYNNPTIVIEPPIK